MGILQKFTNLFSQSGKISTTDFYYIREQLLQWNKTGHYPTYTSLPAGIRFASDFWSRVKELFRHTKGDGHERAVTVWWADGDFVLASNVRGSETQVNIPKQKIQVTYKPTTKQAYAEKWIELDGKLYSKRQVAWNKVNRDKIEVQYLFNMHTHPAHTGATGGQVFYSFFSLTDIRSFIESSVAMTGLVTDKLWLLIKTDKSPKGMIDIDEQSLSPEVLTSKFGFKVYSGKFGRAVIATTLPHPADMEVDPIS